MRSLVIAAVVLAGCPRAQPAPTTPATPKEVVDDANATIEDWRKAQEARNLDAIGKLYAHDAAVIVVQQGMPVVGWPAVESMLKARLAKPTIIVKLKDLQVVSLAPEVASAVASMAREISDGTTSVAETGTLTLVLRRDADHWVIVAEHYSYKPHE
jgi:ketosteroid isomerase-like protein